MAVLELVMLLALLRTVLGLLEGLIPTFPPNWTDPLATVWKVMRSGLELYGSPRRLAMVYLISCRMFWNMTNSAEALEAVGAEKVMLKLTDMSATQLAALRVNPEAQEVQKVAESLQVRQLTQARQEPEDSPL